MTRRSFGGSGIVHYVAMMVVVAGISLYGTGSSQDFRRSYEAAADWEIGEAVGHATAGLRRALREADTGAASRPQALALHSYSG